MISKATEEHSHRIFWVIQTVFGYIIGRSFHTYASVFIPPFENDITTITFTLVTVYSLIIWSWIDFSYTLIVSPYQFNNIYEKFRFIIDLLIVLSYTYLLVYLDYIKAHPSSKISEFFIANAVVFLGYLFSGLLRIKRYGRRASRIYLIIFWLILFAINILVYDSVYQSNTDSLSVNRWFICIAFVLTLAYRTVRSLSGRRKYKIAVDVDGVLANQIDGILPIVKKDLNIDLKYHDVTDWKLALKETSIDKIIVNEQKHRRYVMGMEMHPGALAVINQLIKRHYISIATARPPESDGWTKQWLSANKIPYDTFFNLKEGFKHNEDFDILIDDYIGNIVSFLEKHDGHAILFSQPWNLDRSTVDEYIKNGRLYVVNNWNDVPVAVNTILKRN